eukprot:10122753-Karenia_brevis.AAC.1
MIIWALKSDHPGIILESSRGHFWNHAGVILGLSGAGLYTCRGAETAPLLNHWTIPLVNPWAI